MDGEHRTPREMFNQKGAVVHEVDEGQPCHTCDRCNDGFRPHPWRKTCSGCKCPREEHEVVHVEWVNVKERLGFKPSADPDKRNSRDRSYSEGYAWVPPGLPTYKIEQYFRSLPTSKVPKLGTPGEKYRDKQLVIQLPKQDLALTYCKHVDPSHYNNYEDFVNARNEIALDIAYAKEVTATTECAKCKDTINTDDVAILAPKLGDHLLWHPGCFVCTTCDQLLVDLTYCVYFNQLYCERHYSEQLKPRCAACDEINRIQVKNKIAMGLMLSVLVFCVGVAEILDCWHNFLLHLVQPQYNPLPRHLDLKSDYLTDREVLSPLSESRRTSNVDICWPKDLSPDDDLHVIKKRPHGDFARGTEHDGDSPHRDVRKPSHHEKDTSPLPTSSSGQPSVIITHSPDPNNFLESPALSRESSPNRLELGVIVESESSSEVDEPSQIENLNYKKEKTYETIEKEEEVSGLCSDVGDTRSSDIPRPNCPSAMILEDECDNESIQNASDVEQMYESETELPVFTDNIISLDVLRVSVNYPTNTEALSTAPTLGPVRDNKDTNEDILIDLRKIESSPSEQNAEQTSNNNNLLPISSILNEGLEPISEFPEIKVLESSPVPQADDSDSSLNTSDASWLVRSKTSDRPLVIRFDTSPEKVQQDFQSVVQTDLRALGDKEQSENKGSPSKPLQKADSVDVYYDALVNQNGGDNQGISQSDVNVEEYDKLPDMFENGEGSNEADAKPSSVNVMQIDSNSSSSSLSGVPPLPEDALESLTQIALATDNGVSLAIDMVSTEMSSTQFEDPAMAFLTSNTGVNNEIESCVQSQRKSDESETDERELTPEAQLVQDIDIPDITNNAIFQEASNVEVVSSVNNNGKEKNNISALKGCINKQNTPDNLYNNKKSSSKGTEIKGTSLVVTSGGSVSGSKTVDTSLDSNYDENKIVSSHKDNLLRDEEPAIMSNEDDASKKTKKGSTDLKTQTHSKKLTPMNLPVTGDKKDIKNITAEKSSSGSKAVTSSPTDKNDKSNIPTNSQETTKPLEARKEALSLPKENSSKKQKTKSSSKNSLAESSNTVVLCQAKNSDEEIRAESQAECATVKTNSPSTSNPSKTEFPMKAGSSEPSDEARPSTSKTEEDKSFWLIFSGEYTKAMNKDWHSGHFCCWQCDESLTGQRYVLRDEHPYCVKCYESVFANGCEECSKIIGIDSKDLSYKDKHWHEACFLCNKCRVSLVDKQFGSKLDKIFCGNCYDQQFASRCDGCGNIFKAGTKKMEYKTRQWHEPCFSCCVCKSPIGTKSFIPREQEIYCATCYEEKFATRCVKCNKIITSGGVTYKNEPWHRECFTCTNCNTSLAGQRFTSRDEKPYCAECFGELFAKRCTACSKPITGIGGTRFISFEDRHWHNDCFICASCKTSLVGRGFITDADDIICPECAKQKLM